MVVVMVGSRARIVAQRVLQTSFIIQYLMDQSLIEECLQRTIYSHPVERIVDLFFNVAVRKRIRRFSIADWKPHSLQLKLQQVTINTVIHLC